MDRSLKSIIKTTEPASFSAWKSQKNEHWQPTYETLQNPEKRDLHEALLQEQGYVCCYCGRRIGSDDSHIEHFRPQSRYPALALEFLNLHCSCIKATTSSTPLHCGHRKGDQFDEPLCISPLEPDCEQRFCYSLDGGIMGLNHRAEYMTDLLGLDIPFLRNRRNEVLQGVFDNDFLEWVTPEELAIIRDRARQIDSQGLPDFGHVIARYAEQLLE